MSEQYYYRLEDQLEAAPVDEFDNPIGLPSVVVFVRRYPVQRVTAQYVWLDVHGEDKRIKIDGKKPWASPTLEEAKVQYRARKDRQKTILLMMLKRINEAVDMTGDWSPATDPNVTRLERKIKLVA